MTDICRHLHADVLSRKVFESSSDNGWCAESADSVCVCVCVSLCAARG